MVLFDGLRFTPEGSVEVDSKDRAAASFDDHSDTNHPGQLGCLQALCELHRPYTFINGGDASDMKSVNRHERNRPGNMENTRIKNDLVNLRMLLDAQTACDSIKERVMIDSNHHEWLTLFVAENPQLIGLLDWATVAKTYFPNWNWLIRRENEQNIYWFGDYPFRHGDNEPRSLSACERMFPKGKYIRGHYHIYEAYRRSVSVGCGSKLAPSYTENSINSWQNQMVSVTRFKGVTAVAPKTVLHDKSRPVSRFSYRGKIYETQHVVLSYLK
jgi:hypothetical protein